MRKSNQKRKKNSIRKSNMIQCLVNKILCFTVDQRADDFEKYFYNIHHRKLNLVSLFLTTRVTSIIYGL